MKREVLAGLVFAVVFVIGIGGLFSIKAEGQRENDNRAFKAYEEEYVREVREILCEYNLGCSGVMLTHVTEEGQPVKYTLKIHTGTECEAGLEKALKELELEVPDSVTYVVFN